MFYVHVFYFFRNLKPDATVAAQAVVDIGFLAGNAIRLLGNAHALMNAGRRAAIQKTDVLPLANLSLDVPKKGRIFSLYVYEWIISYLFLFLGTHLFPNSLGKRMKRAAENSEAAKVLKGAHAAQNRGAASNFLKKKGSGRGGGGGGFRNGPSTSRQPDFRNAPSRNPSHRYFYYSFVFVIPTHILLFSNRGGRNTQVPKRGGSSQRRNPRSNQ
jgi:hypothetical protein